MPATKLNILVEQGATFKRIVTVTKKADNLPQNLTSYLVRGMMREAKKGGAVLTSFTCGIVDAALGQFSFELSATATGALTAPVALYDIELESPTGIVYRVYEGTATISPSQTR
jgi:hypothetical protein